MKLKRFLSYYKPYKGLFAADLIASIMVAALSLMLPLCVRYITNDVLQSNATGEIIIGSILRMGLLMIVIIALKTACGLFYDYKGHDMGAKIERDLRKQLFDHYQKLSFSFYDNHNTGDLMSRLTNDLHNLSEVYHHVPEMILINSIQIIGSIVILLIINWKLALIMFAILPVIIVYALIYYKKLQKAYKENREEIANVNTAVQENLSGIRMVKTFANEDMEIKKFSKANIRYYLSRSGIYKSEAFLYSAVEHFFTPLITIVIAVAGGIWISKGSLDIANLLMFIMYSAYLTSPVPAVASIVPFYQQGFAGYSRFIEIIDTDPDINDAEDAVDLIVSDGRVEFKDVNFRYSNDYQSQYVLRNINLEVDQGETIAIVGRSGIGKSTLCSLISRFYDTTEGAVFIDGIDIRNVTQKSLRRQIGVVRQETFLFSGTIMENIMYGNLNANEEEAIEAAKKAYAHDFIMELPDGYQTNIGERGVKLSGGQQQRLSIARVFLKDSPILIFDEPTGALDYESEKAVMRSLKMLSEGRTVFIIAHRLSTIKNADRIIVLTDDGIAEQGTHERLYAMNGVYTKLYDSKDEYFHQD